MAVIVPDPFVSHTQSGQGIRPTTVLRTESASVAMGIPSNETGKPQPGGGTVVVVVVVVMVVVVESVVVVAVPAGHWTLETMTVGGGTTGSKRGVVASSTMTGKSVGCGGASSNA